MTIQIIPNVNKIKIEKKYVSQKKDVNRVIGLNDKQRQELDSIKNHGYYRENIFQLEEMYLYRSVFNTYIGEYKDAISDLNLSWKQHVHQSQQAKREVGLDRMDIKTNHDDEMYGKFHASQLVSPIGSVQSYQSQNTDLSEVGLCSININEYNYNMLINLI